MDVGSMEIWLAAGIREHLAGPGAAGGEQTLQQTTYRRLWGNVAGKVSGIFRNLFLNLVSPKDFGRSEGLPKSCLLKGKM